MSFPTDTKTQHPVCAGDDAVPTMAKPKTKPRSLRMLALSIALSCMAALVVAWNVHNSYASSSYSQHNILKTKYEAFLSQQDAHAMARRAVESNSAALITTTTTVTQGTTVTLETTASSSSSSSFSSSSALSSITSVPAVQNVTMSASAACGTAPAETVTVTVTSEPTTSVNSDVPFVSFSIFSSMEPSTVVETRLTTSTVTVTAGRTTPAPGTQTLTATATEGKTSTEIVTVNPGGGNHTLSGTSTSTADAVIGTGSHTARYPNSTIALTPYGATASGGIQESTASFTVTVPGHTGESGRSTTPFYTTTSAADPIGTIVTVSGASKLSSALAGTVAVAAAFAMLF